ncbi:MAG TPA: hypothetical protein VMT00_13295 [Thermoanaerobaculia bacterium]|nr:hypothetical protein [Thermoanaerobaculia bacterium]
MRNPFPAVVTLALCLTACAVGPRVGDFKPAYSPAGIEVTLNLEGESTLKGELLEVRDSGLVMLNDNEVILISYASIRRGGLAQTGIRIGEGKPPARAAREQLRLLSRYPQGLSPELLASLLSAYGQEKLTIWPR